MDCPLLIIIIVLLMNNDMDLSQAMEDLEIYYTKWSLWANANKTKVMLINHHLSELLYSRTPLEVVKHFRYLGFVVSFDG